MEENKYYTPEIEEFCIGLEYEVLDYAKFGEWSKFTIDLDSITGKEYYPHTNRADFFLENLEIEKVRVKLLDREDIKLLGWNPLGKAVGEWFTKEGDLSEKISEYKLCFYKDSPNILIEAYFGGEVIDTLFKGTILNITELRKLMKMLKIE